MQRQTAVTAVCLCMAACRLYSTSSLWPLNVCSSFSVSRCHIFTVVSAEADVRNTPSRDTSSAFTSLWWAVVLVTPLRLSECMPAPIGGAISWRSGFPVRMLQMVSSPCLVPVTASWLSNTAVTCSKMYLLQFNSIKKTISSADHHIEFFLLDLHSVKYFLV